MCPDVIMAIVGIADYKCRVIDATSAEELKAFGCVAIIGPKMCGKTTTAEEICPSAIHLQRKREYVRCREIADLDPSILFTVDEYPLLIDEWQRIPEIWDEAWSFIDDRQAKGSSFSPVRTTSMRPRSSTAGRGEYPGSECTP